MVPASVRPALVLAHDPHGAEPDAAVDADRDQVVCGRVDDETVVAAVVEQVPRQRADRVGADSWPCRSGCSAMSIPACRYCGSSSSQHWMMPTTVPSTSMAKLDVFSGGSRAPRACSEGSPHHRATPGWDRISRKRAASARTAGRSLTCSPVIVCTPPSPQTPGGKVIAGRRVRPAHHARHRFRTTAWPAPGAEGPAQD